MLRGSSKTSFSHRRGLHGGGAGDLDGSARTSRQRRMVLHVRRLLEPCRFRHLEEILCANYANADCERRAVAEGAQIGETFHTMKIPLLLLVGAAGAAAVVFSKKKTTAVTLTPEQKEAVTKCEMEGGGLYRRPEDGLLFCQWPDGRQAPLMDYASGGATPACPPGMKYDEETQRCWPNFGNAAIAGASRSRGRGRLRNRAYAGMRCGLRR